MRTMIGIALACALLAATACGGDGDSRPDGDVASPVTTAATEPASSSSPSPQASPAPEDAPAEAEVTGIVGSVNMAQRTIEINRLSGADVTRIEVDAATRIRSTGGMISLGEIRPSDRIVARGRVDERTGALIAAEVDVRGVAPVANPGG